MIPYSLNINVTNGKDPITKRDCFVIDGEFPNPILTLYYGYTYRINVKTNNRIKFIIKSHIGIGEIGAHDSDHIDNNVGIKNGIILYTPQKSEKLPKTIVYQSVEDELIYGCIHLLNAPIKYPNGMWIIGGSDRSKPININELIDKLNYNFSNILTKDNIRLGYGLKLENNYIKLDVGNNAIYIRNKLNNKIYLTVDEFTLNDELEEINIEKEEHTLEEWLNIIVTLIRQIKDNSKRFDEPINYSLTTLSEKLKEIKDRVDYLYK